MRLAVEVWFGALALGLLCLAGQVSRQKLRSLYGGRGSRPVAEQAAALTTVPDLHSPARTLSGDLTAAA